MVRIARKLRVFVFEHTFFKDAKKVVNLLVRSHANAIRFPAITQHGNLTFYNSKYFPKYPRIGERDLLQELTHECRKHDIHVIPYNSLGYGIHKSVYRIHPDWALKNADGSVASNPEFPIEGVTVCLNNPDYAETYGKACKEIVSNYDVSGMYFDGPLWGGDTSHPWTLICHCRHCKRIFLDKYGFEFPDNPNLEDDLIRKSVVGIRTHGRKYLMSIVSKEVKSVKKIPVIFNTVGYGPYFLPSSMMNLADGALVAEIHRGDNGGFMYALEEVKGGAAIGKAAWCYCPIGPHEFTTYNNLETQLFGLMELAHGGTPVIESFYSFLHDETGLPTVRELFTHMEKNEELYFDYKPVPFIALHYSEKTVKEGVAPPWHIGHNRYFSGAFSALTHTHQQFNIILDNDLNNTDLRNYKALFLANASCLSDDQIDAVRTFVKEGGGLIATYQTSLFDEEGYQRENFALKDLFKATFRSVDQPNELWSGGHSSAYIRIADNHPVTEGVPKDKLVAYTFYPKTNEPLVLTSSLKGGKVIADIYVVTWEEFGTPLLLPEGGRPTGIVTSSYGKGRVVYMAPALDLLYRIRGFRLVRKLISNAVDWVTKNENPLQTNAPNCVITNLTEEGDTRALHLINYTGNMHENPAYKVEWVAPLSDILINARNPTGKKLLKVKLLTSDKEISFEREGNYATIKLPKLDLYECIILQYK
jgi:hypothetical protein